MTFSSENALWRGKSLRPIISRIGHVLHQLLQHWQRGRRTRPARQQPHISDHLARDMGMTPHELELHRLTLPSQTAHHPHG